MKACLLVALFFGRDFATLIRLAVFNNMENLMKRLAMIAMTGIFGLALSACGGNDAPPMPEVKADDMMQMQQPAQDKAMPAAPGTASEAVTATPAPADNATATDATAPTDDQMTGATAPE